MIHIIMFLRIESRYCNHRSVKRKPKWHRQCFRHFTNQNKRVYQKQNQKLMELSNRRVNANSVANTLQTISFKDNTIILFETTYCMIF